MNEKKTIRVVRCDRCGLCYPSDYFEQWGRKYGRGLGKNPVCEGLASNYSRPVLPQGFIPQSPDQIMHPLHVCKGTMTSCDVSSDEAAANAPVIATTDKSMRVRAEIMRNHQREKSPALDAMVKFFKL